MECESDSEEDAFEPTQANRKRRRVQISKSKKENEDDVFSDNSADVTNGDEGS